MTHTLDLPRSEKIQVCKIHNWCRKDASKLNRTAYEIYFNITTINIKIYWNSVLTNVPNATIARNFGSFSTKWFMT